MALRFFRPGRTDTFAARLERARNNAYVRGFREAKLFKLAVGTTFDRNQAQDWLDNVIDEGRIELSCQRASEREIEIWDMSCRIAFLLEIAT